MNQNIVKNTLKVVRFLGILAGALWLLYILKITVFYVDDFSGHDPDSVLGRFAINSPALLISLILMLPYKHIKKRFVFYPFLLIFILVLGYISFGLYTLSTQMNNAPVSMGLVVLGAWILLLFNFIAFIVISSQRRNESRPQI